MIPLSQQIRIIQDISVSFSKLEKTNTAIGGTLERDKIIYNYKKYESYVLSDFEFLVLYTVYKRSSSKFDTIKILNEYTKDDFKYIKRIKENLVLYKNTVKNDFSIFNTKMITPNNIFTLLEDEQVSVLGSYVFLRNLHLSRIQQKKFLKMEFFLSYFPKIYKFLLSGI